MSTSNQIVAQAHVPLIYVGSEPRVDSRIIAQSLGNEHAHLIRLLTDHEADFEEFGIIRFENGEISGRGRPIRFALLNEDQCYLLLTYSRNSEKAREAKRALVHAFRQARDATTSHPSQDLSPLDLFRQMLTAYEAQQNRLELLEGSQVELEARFDDQPISAHSEKRNHIQRLVQELGAATGGGKNVGLAYRRYGAAFGLPGKFDMLKVSDYPAAVKLLEQWLQDAKRDYGLFN